MHQTESRTRQARRLRTGMTGAEVQLWKMLRSRQFEGLKFRRQVPVAGSIADFLCPALKLVIELDGGIHRLREVEDATRDLKLAEAGFTVLPFGNEAFLRNPNDLLDAVRRQASSVRPHPPHPSGSA
ncbi:MAG: endonuclease domain-containing protein [Brevundimonas sp.]